MTQTQDELDAPEGKEEVSPTDSDYEHSPGGPYGPHLWQLRAVQDAALIAIILGVLSFLRTLMPAIAPVIFGFFAAYLIAPAIRWLERRGISRVFVATVISLVSIVGVGVGAATLLPRLVRELIKLQRRIPQYIDVIRAQTGLDASDLWAALDFQAAMGALDKVEPLLGLLGSVVGTTAYGIVFVILLVTSFVVFNLEFEKLPYVFRYLPQSQRQKLEPLAEVIASVFRGYLRGQLLVMMFTATVYTAGFAFLEVPYGIFAGLVGGLLSVVPYGQLSGPLLAMIFNLLESQVSGDFDPVRTFVLPAAVYAVMQSLETFVVTPLVQGAATRLHPLAILVCLVAGGTIGGLLGVFFAIPITASVWLVAKERIFPFWQRWADHH